MKYSGIGGQAVIEGIMMRNKDHYAVAVRKPDGDIEVDIKECHSYAEKHKWAGLPFIRGVFSFAESMIMGMRTLMYSASFFEDDEEDTEAGPFEKWLTAKFGEKTDKVIMTFSMIFAVIMAFVLFMWFPLFITGLVRKFLHNETLMALIEGVIRVCIFIIYIKIVSRTEDMRRTFMYHGGEHKCINCIEHGLPLTLANVAVSSKEHKRCGTSFIILVMIISILFFMVIRVSNPLLRLLSRIILIPVIAGVSYEVLRLAGTKEGKLLDIVSKPGLCMQALTVYEPDESMIEVAIRATEAVFDWKKFLADNFPDGPDEIGRELLLKAKTNET